MCPARTRIITASSTAATRGNVAGHCLRPGAMLRDGVAITQRRDRDQSRLVTPGVDGAGGQAAGVR
jgi:hypothetical protein